MARSRRRRDGMESVLLEIALQFGATLELTKLLDVVLARVTQLFEAERALFALFDETGVIEHAVTHNMEWSGRIESLPVSRGLISSVLVGGEMVVVPDVGQDGTYNTRDSVQSLGLKFLIGAPVKGARGVIGVLYADSRLHASKDWDQRLDLMDAVSRLVSTAVENARLYQEQQFRARLLSRMVHGLRSPLQVTVLNAGCIEDESLTRAEINEMADDILAQAQGMALVVDNTLELARMDVGKVRRRRELVDIERAVVRHLRSYRALARANDLELVLNAAPGLPLIQAVPQHIWIVVDNLVSNAIKYARAGTRIEVGLRMREDVAPPYTPFPDTGHAKTFFSREIPLLPSDRSRFVEISVDNAGAKIPPDALAAVFNEFSRSPDGPRAGFKSTGLGLAIAAECVRHLGGRIWARSSDESTRFAFTLPTSTTTK